jgi:alkylation response protein AidB-like acyl-CoA dehydrogenase
MTLEHVRQRSQFDRPIGSFQAVKHRVADMFIELQGARVATRDAADAVQLGRSDADFAVHGAKSWTGRTASRITSEAVQLHGSPGWHEERLVELLRPDPVSPTVR